MSRALADAARQMAIWIIRQQPCPVCDQHSDHPRGSLCGNLVIAVDRYDSARERHRTARGGK